MPSALENLSDRQLALCARSPAAPSREHFEEIVRRYQVPLRHFLAQRFPFRRDLDDILQDSFLKAWQSLHLFNPNLALRTWLYTVTYRTAISQARRDRPAQTLPATLSSNAPAPDASALQQDERATLWQRARDILPDEQFTILWLHYVDDLPATDIARVLNRSWVSVKTLLHRARKKLAAHLARNQSAPREKESLEPRWAGPADSAKTIASIPNR